MPTLTPFQVVFGAARAALLCADDHEKVKNALRTIATEQIDAEANENRLAQATGELAAATKLIERATGEIESLRAQLKAAEIEPDEDFVARERARRLASPTLVEDQETAAKG